MSKVSREPEAPVRFGLFRPWRAAGAGTSAGGDDQARRSRFAGVSWDARAGAWRVTVHFEGGPHPVGRCGAPWGRVIGGGDHSRSKPSRRMLDRACA
jgi:hypothetical protein